MKKPDVFFCLGWAFLALMSLSFLNDYEVGVWVSMGFAVQCLISGAILAVLETKEHKDNDN